MSTSIIFDKTTLEAQLARAIQDRSNLEQFGAVKQKELNEFIAKTTSDIDKIRGALDYNTMVINNIKKDIELLKINSSPIPVVSQEG